MSEDRDAGAPPAGQGEERTGGAWRLTFAYEGDDVRLVSRQHVRMQAPPDDAALVRGGERGFWVEVRDAQDRPVYQQVLHRPVQHEFEVHSPERDALPHHVPAPEVRGVFQAVVPDLPEGRAVAVQGAEPSAAQPPDAQPPDGERSASSRRDRRAARPVVRTLVVAPLQAEAEEEDGDGHG